MARVGPNLEIFWLFVSSRLVGHNVNLSFNLFQVFIIVENIQRTIRYLTELQCSEGGTSMQAKILIISYGLWKRYLPAFVLGPTSAY